MLDVIVSSEEEDKIVYTPKQGGNGPAFALDYNKRHERTEKTHKHPGSHRQVVHDEQPCHIRHGERDNLSYKNEQYPPRSRSADYRLHNG